MTKDGFVNLYRRLYTESRYGCHSGGIGGRMQYFQIFLKYYAPPPARLLEVSCGRGEFASLMARTGYDVTATEIHAEIADSLGPVKQFSIEYLPHLSFPDGAFDIVVCSDVLEHLENEEVAKASVADLARVTNRILMISAAQHVTTAAKYLPDDATQLHLVRKPAEWWRDQFEKHCTVVTMGGPFARYLFGEKKCQVS